MNTSITHIPDVLSRAKRLRAKETLSSDFMYSRREPDPMPYVIGTISRAWAHSLEELADVKETWWPSQKHDPAKMTVTFTADIVVMKVEDFEELCTLARTGIRENEMNSLMPALDPEKAKK